MIGTFAVFLLEEPRITEIVCALNQKVPRFTDIKEKYA